jgi:putative N-acetylmannosamine-6-phosphate epimerase
LGATQFGKNARLYRKKFMNDPDLVLELLEVAYKYGARGIEIVPVGRITEAAEKMMQNHSDFIVTGSTAPGPNPMIDELVQLNAKIIFAHGMVSDKQDDHLIKLLDEISSTGAIPGIALHNPISTIKFALENTEAKTFLVPFNLNGLFMGSQRELEQLIDGLKNCSFIGMKTLAAGKLDPDSAFSYVTKHNICAVTIGMTSINEAESSTKIALNHLQHK